MEKPRSVYLAFEAFPRPKGSSSHIAAMVGALARRRAPVWLLCCGYGDMPARQVEGSVTIWRYKAYHPNMLRRAAGFAEFVEELLAPVAEDLELCVFRDPWGGAPALAAAPECPAVFEVNALPSWELGYSYPAVRHNAALRAKIEDAERFCLGAADRLLTVSPVTRDALVAAGVGAERIEVLANSASEEFFAARAEDCPLPQLREGTWFGYVGSLHPWQGLEVAVEALALLGGDLGAARFLVVHNGRRAPLKRVRKLIRKRGLGERVVLHPPMAPARLAPTLAALCFTLAPLTETARNTRQGCCPVKIVESMAAGTPVLASDIRAVRALVTDGFDGLLVRPGAPRAWALAIRRALGEPGLLEHLAAGARAAAARHFDRRAATEDLSKCFDRAERTAVGRRPEPAAAPAGN
jgi:glycosyltransferase involved in cell wall biosynthesis